MPSKRKRLEVQADELVAKLTTQLHAVIAPNIHANDRASFDRSLLKSFQAVANKKSSGKIGALLTDNFKHYSDVLWEKFSAGVHALKVQDASLGDSEQIDLFSVPAVNSFLPQLEDPTKGAAALQRLMCAALSSQLSSAAQDGWLKHLTEFDCMDQSNKKSKLSVPSPFCGRAALLRPLGATSNSKLLAKEMKWAVSTLKDLPLTEKSQAQFESVVTRYTFRYACCRNAEASVDSKTVTTYYAALQKLLQLQLLCACRSDLLQTVASSPNPTTTSTSIHLTSSKSETESRVSMLVKKSCLLLAVSDNPYGAILDVALGVFRHHSRHSKQSSSKPAAKSLKSQPGEQQATERSSVTACVRMLLEEVASQQRCSPLLTDDCLKAALLVQEAQKLPDVFCDLLPVVSQLESCGLPSSLFSVCQASKHPSNTLKSLFSVDPQYLQHTLLQGESQRQASTHQVDTDSEEDEEREAGNKDDEDSSSEGADEDDEDLFFVDTAGDDAVVESVKANIKDMIKSMPQPPKAKPKQTKSNSSQDMGDSGSEVEESSQDEEESDAGQRVQEGEEQEEEEGDANEDEGDEEEDEGDEGDSEESDHGSEKEAKEHSSRGPSSSKRQLKISTATGASQPPQDPSPRRTRSSRKRGR